MVTNLNLLYISLFLAPLFLCHLCAITETETTINIQNNDLKEKEVHSVFIPYKTANRQNTIFGSGKLRNKDEALKECRNCPAKFTKHIRIINYMEPSEDGEQEIRVEKDEYSYSEKPKNESKRGEFKSKINDNIISYFNKDGLLNKIYDTFLTNYSYDGIKSEDEKKDISNRGDKITLMQLENESKESMLRQFRENQRKTKPCLIIHTHKMYPININHSFVKRSSTPQNIPCFDDYGMINISPSEEEAELDGYANHPLWIENAARNIRTTKRLLGSDQASSKYDLNSRIGNNTVTTKIKNDRQCSENKQHLIKKVITYLSPHKLRRSENLNKDEYYELSQKIPTLSYDDTEHPVNDFIAHKRRKHQQNLNNEESGYFSSDFISSPEEKPKTKHFRMHNGTVIGKQRKKNRKNKYVHTRPRGKKIKHNSVSYDKLKRFYSHKKIPSRFKKHLYTSYAPRQENCYNLYHFSKNNKVTNKMNAKNFEEAKDIRNKINHVSSCFKKTGDHNENIALNENGMAEKTVHTKYANNKKENRLYRSNLNVSPVADNMRSYHNNPDFVDLNIAGELTPVYPILCERTCENTTPNCKSTAQRICGCKFTFPPE